MRDLNLINETSKYFIFKINYYRLATRLPEHNLEECRGKGGNDLQQSTLLISQLNKIEYIPLSINISTVFFMYAFLRKTKKYECLLCIFLSAQEGIHEEDCTI